MPSRVLYRLRHAAVFLAAFGLLSLAVAPAHADFTPTSDFTDNRDGTVTHKLTGLTWMRCSMGQTWDGATCTGTAGAYTFDGATKLTSSLANYSDWRLPNPWDLASIVDYDIDRPAINGALFPNTPSSRYWTGTPYATPWKLAWCVNFGYGFVDVYNSSDSNAVRLVRGGRPLGSLTTPTADFTDNGDGTVTHKITGLTWKRCAEGQNWSGSTCSGAARAYSFDQAVAVTSDFTGKTDWRIPNILELASIVEYAPVGSTINGTIFPNTPLFVPTTIPPGILLGGEPSGAAHFWSGSPDSSSPGSVWAVYFNTGETSYANRSSTPGGHLRLVRGTQSAASSNSGADCLFNWAERTYAQFFAPAGVTSQTSAPYYYRYYSGTANYLATSSANNHIWVLGPSFGNGPLDVGSITSYLTAAGCSQ